MLIVCPSCATAFRVSEAVLGEAGRQVRCAQCRTVWLATREAAIEEPAAAGAGSTAGTGPASADPAGDDADWGAAFAEEARERTPQAGPQDEPGAGSGAIPIAESPSIQPDSNVVPLPVRAGAAGTADNDDDDDDADAAPRHVTARAASGPGRHRRAAPPRPRPPFRMSLPVTVLLLGTAILATFLLGREEVVRTVPDTAGIYEQLGLPVNLRGVEFRDVKGANEIVDGVVVLVVEGRLVNITGKAVDLPRLRLAVRDATGKEIYTWTATAPKAQLEPGEAVPFRSRLASPPPDGASVEVRFFTRLDAQGR